MMKILARLLLVLALIAEPASAQLILNELQGFSVVNSTCTGAISEVGTPTTDSAINGGALNVSMPTGVATGDVVYVGVAFNSAQGSFPPSGWTQIGSTVVSTVRVSVIRKIMGAVPDSSVSVPGNNGSSNSESGIAIAFRNVDQTTPEDSTATTASAGSGSPNSPSITPTTTGAAVIAYSATSLVDTTGTGGPSGYSDFTQRSSNDTNSTTSYLAWIASRTGGVAEDPGSISGVTSAAWGAFTIAVRPCS